MAKKSSGKSLLIVGAIGAGLWWLLSGGSASASTPTLGPAAQGYMNKIIAAQNQLLNGVISQVSYTSQAVAILLGATTDSSVSTAELNYMHQVAGV